MMSMAVTMHPIWQSGAVVLVAGVAGALIAQILVQRLLPAEVRRAHTELGAAMLLLIVGLNSPFHGAVTIAPDAYAGVLTEMREAR
jgi:hypothetical protein